MPVDWSLLIGGVALVFLLALPLQTVIVDGGCLCEGFQLPAVRGW